MERSNTSPFRQNAAAVLRVLSDAGTADTMSAQLVSSSPAAVVINVSKYIDAGTAVSLEIDGGLVLAEVAQCSQTEGPAYVARLTIDQVIPSLSELARLMEAITAAGDGSRRRSVNHEPDRRHR